MTWAELLDNSAALLNDAAQEEYTDAVLLPFLNMTLFELQEVYELNNIPATNETSAKLDVPALTTAIAYSATTPVLPPDLVEIQRLWCSPDGRNLWLPVTKRDYLTQDEVASGSTLQFFSVWAWMNNEIRLLPSTVPLDIKLDYIQYLFTPLLIGGIGATITLANISSTVQYRVAGLAAEFINENPGRANSLNMNASNALDRTLGISTKGRQSIMTRRRPFRAAYKRRGVLI